MIRILFDHQYLETNNIDIYNFYNELIKKLKEIKEFHIIEAHNRKELISFINGNSYLRRARVSSRYSIPI